VRFYADENNWQKTRNHRATILAADKVYINEGLKEEAISVGGKRARQCLKEIGE